MDLHTTRAERFRILAGIATGLLAASIGALYTVFARWGTIFLRNICPDVLA